MATEQRMLARGGCAALLSAVAICFTACVNTDRLRPPQVLFSPYMQAEGDVLWAVAPLRNESGTSAVDPLLVSDELVAQIHQIEGVSVVPLNRSLGAMNALGIAEVDSTLTAGRLAQAMGVDAILTGTITAYDPYDPPSFGLSLALFSSSRAMGATGGMVEIDPIGFQASPTDRMLPASPGEAATPLNTFSDHFDGASHEVQMSVQRYASGRYDNVSALSWRRYLASMPLFTRFACHRAVQGLLDAERLRLGRLATADEGANQR